MPYVITANLLATGAVVYRDGAGNWRADVATAELLADADTTGTALGKARADASVVDSDAIEVTSEPPIVPLRLRERIRAFGPTVATGSRPASS